MKILFIGDIVGSPGREAIRKLVAPFRQDHGVDFVIANAENASGGSGITSKVAEDLFASGVDVITSGDHIWKKSEIFELIVREERILRPLNFPSGAPAAVPRCSNQGMGEGRGN
jgi:calcineurin-like phosphoesterase